jgi:prepilin-type N-terminal cleavage/methylation domain-containing protein
MRKKGFTLVELLVVIAIIALLMGILMPALARVRMIANRMVCGANMSGIGKGLVLYANDFAESYPMPGIILNQTTYSSFGRLNDWQAILPNGATGAFAGGTGGMATIGSVFYSLVKYEDVSPKQFTCKGDSGAEVFKLTTYTSANSQTDLTKVWDFGSQPGRHNSYSYHMPFTRNNTGTVPGFPISMNSKPTCPLAADRNPTMDKNANPSYISGGAALGGTAASSPSGLQTPYQRWVTEYKDPDLLYNSYAHQREGQNVLFNDNHVKFEATANVGINNDNIWQQWSTFVATGSSPVPSTPQSIETGGKFPDKPAAGAGYAGGYSTIVPADFDDALLIGETQDGGIAPPASDCRLKVNVQPLGSVMDKIDKLYGVTFYWNDIGKTVAGNTTGKREIGVIAQDVEAVFPELVVTGSDGYRRVDYAKMTAVLIEAVKELKAQNETLQLRIDALEKAAK